MSDTLTLVRALADAGTPVIITGPPGGGKTAAVLDLEKSTIQGKRVKVFQLIASTRDPADIGGYPAPDFERGVVRMMANELAVQATEAYEQGFFVIIFIDEARTVPAPMQAAVMKLIHERRFGDYVMPFGIRFIAAANSVEESAGGVPLEAPMANRFAHLAYKVDYEKWCEAMTLNTFRLQTPLSEEAETRLGAERALVSSFIARNQSLLHAVPKDEDQRDGPWPSPRTWDYTAHSWAAVGDKDLNLRQELMAACVSMPVAGTFIAWQKAQDLPDPEDVLAGTWKGTLVDKVRPDRTYAIINSVVAAAANKWDSKRYEQAWKVMGKAAEDGGGDIAAALVNTLTATTEGRPVASIPSIAKYATAFMDLLNRSH